MDEYSLALCLHPSHQTPAWHLQGLKKKQNGCVGTVKLQCKINIVIPAGWKMALNGRVRNVSAGPGTTLLVEPPTHSSLPDGLIFCSYVMSSPRQTSFKVPILLKNETAHDIVVSAHRPLAEISVPLSVSPPAPTCENQTRTKGSQQKHSFARCHTTSEVKSDNLTLHTPNCRKSGKTGFQESWVPCLRFSLEGNLIMATRQRGHDIRHKTRQDDTRHKIWLSDPTPFKQRPRPIHPSDYEAVRFHLKQLSDSNIIRESESPFASPIVVVKKKYGQIL